MGGVTPQPPGSAGAGQTAKGRQARSRTGTASERDQARAAETGPDAPRRRGAQRRHDHRANGGRAPLFPCLSVVWPPLFEMHCYCDPVSARQGRP